MGRIKQGTEARIIFRDNRIGEISDILAIPASELSPALVSKKGVQESEIDWAAPVEPNYGEATQEEAARFKKSLDEMNLLAKELNDSQRARAAIDGWKRDIAVKTKAGECARCTSTRVTSASTKGLPSSPTSCWPART